VAHIVLVQRLGVGVSDLERNTSKTSFIEALLSALRPHEVSSGLRQRVAELLAVSSPPKKRRRPWRIALAASLAAVLFGWGGDRVVKPQPIVVRPRLAPPVMVVDSRFTILAYERALARSPEDLDTLLAKGTAVAPEFNPEQVILKEKQVVTTWLIRRLKEAEQQNEGAWQGVWNEFGKSNEDMARFGRP
jgi:hypothetical protein